MAKLYPLIDSLHFVAYYSSPPEAMASIIREALLLTHSILGEEQLEAALTTGRIGGSMESSSETFRLGSPPDFLGRFAAADAALVLRSAVTTHSLPGRRGVDVCTWQLEYDDSQISHAMHVGPSLRIHFNIEAMCEGERERLSEHIASFAKCVAGVGEFCYGSCDVADIRETALGRLYSLAFLNNCDFQRRLNRTVWEMEGDARLHRARGVYWGNLFSQKMVTELGGIAWLRQFEALDNVPNHALLQPLPLGAYLVLLCSHFDQMLRNSLTFYKGTVLRGAHLYNQLCRRGLMCGGHLRSAVADGSL